MVGYCLGYRGTWVWYIICITQGQVYIYICSGLNMILVPLSAAGREMLCTENTYLTAKTLLKFDLLI